VSLLAPRPRHTLRRIADAAAAERRHDPTGTGPLRWRFAADLDRRWARLKRLTIEAVGKSDILGLGGPTVATIAALPHGNKVEGFRSWFDAALRAVILVYDGRWTRPYIEQSMQLAKTRAQKLTIGDAGPPDELRDPKGQWTSGGGHWFSAKENDEYVYHGTTVSNLESIKETGLTRFLRVYFASNPKVAMQYAFRGHLTPNNRQEGALLRVRKEDVDKESFKRRARQDFWTGNDIPPEKIEIRSKGKWIPLSEHKQVKDSAGHRQRHEEAEIPSGLYEKTAELVEKAAIDHGVECPWLAGRSRDGSVVYIDERVPRYLPKTGIDTWKTLPWHELAEWSEQNDGRSYDDDGASAHPIATAVERRRVEELGGDWDEYSDEMAGYVEKTKQFDPNKVPSDIDKRPFLSGAGGGAVLRRLGDAYDPDEPRDPKGKWTSGQALEKLANTFKEKHSLRVLNLYRTHQGHMHLSDIEVPRDLRKQGRGSAALKDIVAYADKHNMRITLTPALRDERHGTTSRSRLVKFYKQFGFVENKGRNTDFTISEYMYRDPKKDTADTQLRDAAEGVTLASLTVAELSGICDAVGQQAVRAVATGILHRERPALIARRVGLVINSVGRARSRQMAGYMIVKAFSVATLEEFRARGVTKVGTRAERLIVKGPHGKHLVKDKKGDLEKALVEHYQEIPAFAPGGSPEEIEAAEEAEETIQALEEVEVLTAGDDDVCFPAFTLVRTSVGDKLIQHVRVGDEVLTRAGFKKVVQIGSRKHDGRLLKISTVAKSLERIAITKPSPVVHVAETSRLMNPLAVSDRTETRNRISGTASFPKTLIVHIAEILSGMCLSTIWHRALSWWGRHNTPSLICTSDHPIWCSRNGFTPAHELLTRDVLQLTGNKFIEVGSIFDLGFGYANSYPTGVFHKLLSFIVGFGVPVGSVNFQRNAVQGKVYNIASNLQFLNERNIKTFERLSDSSFDRSFSAEHSITASRAETSCAEVSGRNTEFFVAFQAFCKMCWASTFFRAVVSVKPSSNISRFMKEWLTATSAFLLDVLHLRSLTFDRAEAVAVSSRSFADSKLFSAADTDFGNRVGSAGIVAGARAERPPFRGWYEGIATLFTWSRKNFALSEVRADTRAVPPVATVLISGLSNKLKYFAASFALESERHWNWFLCRGLLTCHWLLGTLPTVYDLTVEDKHEFYANGILVHNCFECEDISDSGPYDIDEALSLVPVHLHCRCSWIPANDARFANVRDYATRQYRGEFYDFDPDQPRVPAGSPGGGEWSGGGFAGVERAGSAGEAEKAAGTTAAGHAKLSGLPDKSIDLGAAGFYAPGPNARIHAAAVKYMQDAGLHYDPPKSYEKVDKERAARIAGAFDAMPHAPDDPAVQASYAALARETLAQWQAVKATGLKVEWIKPGQKDPYAASPRLAALDVAQNNHWWGFPTDQGFGSGEEAEAAKHNNPMLTQTDEVVDGRKLLVNDVFRIVHDYFGHFKDGVGFRAEGEDNAWRSHVAMFSDAAKGAMTSETRGQNSWVNFGPYGEANRKSTAADTHYAPQKIGLMPEWTWKSQ
jgi:GNAT superfamily N-acetyltransferase